MKPDATQWSDYRPWMRAILDEYARTIVELEGIVSAIPQTIYTARSTLSDDEFPAIREIMWHVVGASNRYVDYIEDVLAGADEGSREHNYDFATPDQAMNSLWQGFGRTVAVLGTIRDKTDEELQPLVFTTRWGQRYDIEQVLEHAIVHILRHRRQIERWLAALGHR